MDSINGMPLIWDNEGDKNLFGKLFNQGQTNPTLENNFPNSLDQNPQKRNPFSFSPLSKTGNDVRDNFFGGSKIYNYINFEFVVDPSSNKTPPEKLKIIEDYIYNDTNKSGTYGDTRNGIKDRFLFKVKLFISKDKNQIDNVYNDPTVIAGDDEILLFLEDNTGDWSGSTFYKKVGRNITKEKFDILLNAGTNKNYTSYLNELNQKYNISLPELIEYLQTGEVKNTFLDIVSFIFEVSSLFFTDTRSLKLIASGIETAINFIKKECLIDDSNWNPAKAKNFEPILFPGVSDLLDAIDDKEINQYLKKGVTNLKEKIDKYDTTIEKILLGISTIPTLSILRTIPGLQPKDTFSELLLEKYHFLRTIVYQMLDDAENLDFSDGIKEGIQVINAVLCGIWNGFVEAICGIISLIQYLFEGAAFLTDLLRNFKIRGPEILEKIDDITLSFKNLDFKKIYNKLVTAIQSWTPNGFAVSLVEIAYFCGAFIGFVVELAVEIVGGILISGGVLSVEAVLVKLGEVFKALVSLIFGAIKLPVAVAGKTLNGFLEALKWLYELLVKGTDEFLRIIDEVFAKLKVIAEELATKLKDILSKEGKTEEFFRIIEKKFNLAGDEILSISDLKKLRRLLDETFKVPLEFVDINPLLKAKLKDWTSRRVAGSFNMVEGVMYLRKNVTAYTVQHEMHHMKLWYKMTKEFPELKSLFQKTLGVQNRLFHEEYVLAEFMKNPSKWNEADLLNDLEFINTRLREPNGLIVVNLEYYKKWNLEQELLKFK
jgi:Metallopeptidase toxin 4